MDMEKKKNASRSLLSQSVRFYLIVCVNINVRCIVSLFVILERDSYTFGNVPIKKGAGQPVQLRPLVSLLSGLGREDRVQVLRVQGLRGLQCLPQGFFYALIAP